jgi:formate dehydrogenase
VNVTVSADGHVKRIAPDKENPYTWRDFCPKGRTAAEVVEHPQRILRPMRRVGDSYREATYEEAISDISARLTAIIDHHGADAVGFYWGNPGGASTAAIAMFTALMEATGSRSRYFVGSVDQNNTHVVADAMYGTPLVALIPDVDECDYFLLLGMNPAHSGFTWLWSVPDGWSRVLARQAEGARVVVVDPRRTATADKACLHISIRPGQDWAFLLGMVKVILEEELTSESAVPFDGVEELRKLTCEATLAELSSRCDVPADLIAQTAREFAGARTALCLAHTGVAHHTTGTLGEWLTQVLNHITARVDQPGGRRFERGFVDLVSVFERFAPPLDGNSRLRDLPAIAGHHSLAELADEIRTPGPGQIRAMLINAGNPVNSGPDGQALDEAFGGLELLVAIDFVQRESHRHADWLIPAVHWLERDDLLTLSSGLFDQPYVHFGQRAVAPPQGLREEWTFLVDLALAMRTPLFGKRGVNSFIKASRRLAAVAHRPSLAFHPRWIDRVLIASGRALRWKDIKARPHGWIYREREYGDFVRALRTDDHRVHGAPPAFVEEARRHLTGPIPTAPDNYPFQLVNRRHRESMNSWLNESPGLHRRDRGNELEIHPDDASRLGITDGAMVRVSSAVNSIHLPARTTDRVRRGVVASAHGWGSRVFDPRGGDGPTSYGANRNLLVSNAEIDPFSQTPALSSTYVQVALITQPPGTPATAAP